MAIETRRQPIASRYITYEEYLADEGDNHNTEWVNGKVLDISMVSEEHSDVSIFILVLLRLWAEEHQAGVVRADPFNMKTGPNLPGRSPDVLFLANAHRERLRRNFLDGPCDLAVEVVSPDYRQRDTVEKFDEYAQGGVPEYWIVDYEVAQARFFALGANHVYEEIPVGSDHIFRSRVLPGLWLDTRWLWQRPLPTTRDLLRAWGL
jgi:Uma2 family endonuclease